MKKKMAISTRFSAFDVNPKEGAAPLTVTIEGALVDVYGNPLAGKLIRIYRNGEPIKDVTTGYAGYAGYFKIQNTITIEGTFNYYASWGGDATYSSCLSSVITVKVGIVSVNTQLSIAASPSKAVVPFSTILSGKLTRTDTGAGLATQNIRLYKDLTYVGVVLTDSGGNYSFTVPINVVGSYEFHSEFMGAAEFKPSSSNVVSVTGTGLTTSLTIQLYTVPKYMDEVAEIRGVLNSESGFLANMMVNISRRVNAGTWYLIGNVTTGSDGSFVFSETIKEVGVYEWIASFEGSGSYSPADSNIVSCQIVERPPPQFCCTVCGVCFGTQAELDAHMKEVHPTVPTEPTHALRCYYYNVLGLSAETIDSNVRSIVLPLVNNIIQPLGFDYVSVECKSGYAPQWQKGYFDVNYRARGTPAVPVALILTTIIAVITGIVICYVAWVYLETKTVEAEEKKSLDDLLKEGYITQEQWAELRKTEEETGIDKMITMMVTLIMIVIVAAILIQALGLFRKG